MNLIVLAGSPWPVPCVRSMGALTPPFTEATPLPPLSNRAIFRGTGESGYSLDKRV